MKIALSIAGSDSGAGAGIQADLKTFSALGVYGCTVITAITAQNTRQVAEVFEVSPRMVKQQIRSIITDMPPDAIKIGMVHSRGTIEAIHSLLKKSRVPIVLDPIMAAGTGARLLREDAFDAFVLKLIPICTLITPNRSEAEILAEMKIRTENDGIEAAKKIRKLGAENVIIKGGHFASSSVTDLLIDVKGELTKKTNARIDLRESHGSGCNFSAAMTACLAKGSTVEDAFCMANGYVHVAIKSAVKIGRGLPVTNPISAIYRDASRYQVITELQSAVEQVCSLDGFYRLIPETSTNFAYAISDPVNVSDVAAVRGRIVRAGSAALPTSYIEFGASKHMASAIIAYMKVNPAFRSVINIKFSEELVRICKNRFSVSDYDRRKEPAGIKIREGSSVSWGTIMALSRNPKADVLYHRGDIGKEPMITVFGTNAGEVVAKIKAILEKY